MGGYDSRKFSKEFSKRTVANMDYIIGIVNQGETVTKEIDDFLSQYDEAIRLVDNIAAQIRDAASEVSITQKKGKSEQKRKLYSVANKLLDSKRALETSLHAIKDTNKIAGDKLYEVTQMLNSLMGIAVLPYEMHKELFGFNNSNSFEEMDDKAIDEIHNSIKGESVYSEFREKIMEWHRDGKWVTTYPQDKTNGHINEDRIVFCFLYHLRNAVCHSGDNAISILPLSDGEIIKEVLFHDINPRNDNQEFAMKLTVKELEELIKQVDRFYSCSQLGDLDKTQKIKKAEARVEKLLGIAR